MTVRYEQSDQESIPDLASAADIQARPSYRAGLYFAPNGQHQFGSIVAPYHLTGPKIKCGIGDCGSPHWHGYLITTGEGIETNIGKDCGKKHFHADFQAEMRRHDALYQRKLRIKRVLGIQGEIPGIVRGILDLQQRDQAQLELRSRFRGAVSPKTLQALTDRARRKAPNITRVVQLRGAEAAAFYATAGKKGGPAVREEVVGTIRGLDYFSHRIRDILDVHIVPRLEELRGLSEDGIVSLRPKDLSFWAKLVDELPGKIEQAMLIADAGDRFFAADNLEVVALLESDAAGLGRMIRDIRGDS
ncbi:hypothetical protein AUR59_020235 [Stutzerimonas balearica]|jgi:hypothetical protein|nr:hypothetical protein AUR59_020235 [Stutzerimonas balearica]